MVRREGEEEELPDVLDALDQTLKAQEAAEKVKQIQVKGKSIGHGTVKAKGRKGKQLLNSTQKS